MAAELGKLFGEGSAARQLLLWAVLQELISAALAPELELLAREVNKLLPATPLSPAELADMVVKGHVSEADGESYARESGIAPADFKRLVDDAGEPPGLEFLLQAYRRGFIEQAGTGSGATSLEQGIRESRLKDKWIATIEKMGLQPIPVADAIDAWVKGQVTPEFAQNIAYQGGIKADDAVILYNTRGNPPSPSELAELLKRGLIPLEGMGPDVLSFQQGIAEGASRNKWWREFAALADYIPPPRTVTAMVREGAFSDDQALALFKASGLTQDLAEAYLHAAHHQKLAATKELSKADVEQLYRDQLISAADATAFLGPLGWTTQEIGFILAVQDFKRTVAVLNGAIGRVRSLYVAHKIARPTAINALGALHVPAAQQQLLLGTWDVERTTNVKVLTTAEIAQAFFIGLIDQATATAELQNQGYQPYDAWLILSLRKKVALPGRPPAPTIA